MNLSEEELEQLLDELDPDEEQEINYRYIFNYFENNLFKIRVSSILSLSILTNYF